MSTKEGEVFEPLVRHWKHEHPEFVRHGDERAVWVSKARCRSTDPDEFFVRGAAQQRKAAVICRQCPVVAECLADALGNQMEFGVWGGMTERQRRVLLKQDPEVAEFFAAQRCPTGVDQRAGRRKALQGQPSRAAAERARAMANSVQANERRREPPVIAWGEAIANLLDILDDTSLLAPPPTFRRRPARCAAI